MSEPRSIGVAERRARLARRHLLAPGTSTDDVAGIADALVALHSSDPVTVHLSAAARMRSPSIEAVERALYDERRVVRHHAMRRTLWVATPPSVRTMHAAATRKLVAPERRRTENLLAAAGVADPAGWLDAACAEALAALEARGPMTARALGEAVPALRVPLALAPGKPYAGTAAAHTRVILQLGFEGRLLRGRPVGSWVSGAYEYAAADQWIPGGLTDAGGDDDGAEREAATVLADTWLRRFGPATSADLQWWAGWTKTLTARALAGCGAVQVDLDGTPGWVAAGDDEPVPDPGPWVAALPGLDPTVMGWKQREWYLDPACADAFDRNGNAGPTLWVDGRVVGAWAQGRDGRMRTHYFLDVPASRRRELAAVLDGLADLVGDVRFSVRFPGRVQSTLLGAPVG